MIGVDTNVLVRFFVGDDPEQSATASRFFEAREADTPLYVNVIVVVELVWALKKVYGLPAGQVRAAVSALCESYNVVVQYRELVERALAANEQTGADIADVLIAGLNRATADTRTMTFDKAAAKHIDDMDLFS